MIRDGESDVPLGAIERFIDGGYVVIGERIARLDHGGASSWLGMLRTHGRMRIPEARRPSFLEELFASPTPPPLDLPAGVALAEIAATPTPRLVLHTSDSAPGSLFAELTFVYEGAIVRAQRAGRVAYDPTCQSLVRRDPEAEARARAQLDALGIEPLGKTAQPPPEGAHLAVIAARLPEIVVELEAAGFRVEANTGRAYRAASGLRMALSSGVDWFDVEGDIDFGSATAGLPRVLDALRRGQRFVVLDDGSLGVLPEAWLAQHGLVVLRLGASHEGRIRFAGSQAPLLAELASGERALSFDRTFAEVRAALAADSTVAPADPPPGFLGELRGYQRAGLGWLQAIARTGLGGLLADDMGLGKTVQILAHLTGRRGRPSLIVAPRSLVFNWKREAARFTPGLRVLDHTGIDRRPPGAHFAEHDLVLTTYGTLRRDADALAAIRFDHVVLDEAQAIKNEASETSRAARRLSADRRLALSGTPVENHLGELWSLIEFLNPGMLGRATAWKAATEGRPNPESIALLGRALRPLMLRRTKAEVAPISLPAWKRPGSASSKARRARSTTSSAIASEPSCSRRPNPREWPPRAHACSRRSCVCARLPVTPASSILPAVTSAAPSWTRCSPSSRVCARAARKRWCSRSSARSSTSSNPRSRPRVSPSLSSTGRPVIARLWCSASRRIPRSACC